MNQQAPDSTAPRDHDAPNGEAARLAAYAHRREALRALHAERDDLIGQRAALREIRSEDAAQRAADLTALSTEIMYVDTAVSIAIFELGEMRDELIFERLDELSFRLGAGRL